jgi:hypothetical protein
MNRPKQWVALCLCLAAAGTALQAAGSGASPAAQGMSRLSSLVGTWEAKGPEGNPVKITFSMAGEGSTVMEHLSLGDMITMYHRDGENLMLTHYCAGNNQPRMRATGLSADGKSIAFKFQDVTNLESPDAPHMKGLTITFDDADHITEEWTHGGAGHESPMVIHLARVK